MEEAGFVNMAIWVLFQSGPEVAGDEHLGEESHSKNVNSSDKYYHSESNVISNVDLFSKLAVKVESVDTEA